MVAPRYEYQYDDFGRQTLVRDPLGRETRFEYDAYGNQVVRTLPLGFGEDGIQGTADGIECAKQNHRDALGSCRPSR